MTSCRFLSLFLFILCLSANAETGYDLWLRYQYIEMEEIRNQYALFTENIYVDGSSPTMAIVSDELSLGLEGMLNQSLSLIKSQADANLVIAKFNELDPSLKLQRKLRNMGEEGYSIYVPARTDAPKLVITANSDVGLLRGTFHFLRLLQMREELAQIDITERPAVDVRILNHWDNLDRTSERGYAGFSIWDWHRLPKYMDQRYTDYARANASLGLNATVLTNVNANALVLTPHYLEKVKALADLFRPYGIRVYLTARFSAPIEIGGLETADPLNENVQKWWNEKVAEIYDYIPYFGGFLVKANSEGQPGPQNYGRSHADGANMLADAVESFGGIVMWRAFVYSNEEPVDRAKQAYNEFKPLDGAFRDNVLIQVKNGPIDFQPREPFHPLFGAMPETPLMMEFQITQEYLGQATQMVYLANMWKEVLDTDTYVEGEGSTVARVVDGSLHDYSVTGIAGVANIGTDINWTGHLMAQSNWYAFGRLAWDPTLTAQEIAREWITQTFGKDPEVSSAVNKMMQASWEASVSYMTPLGLHHIMGPGHHYGPGPWVKDMPRADWTSVYYHKADEGGIGFDRTGSGSNALEQMAPELQEKFGDPRKCPDEFLLWFHHLPWDYEMKSGRTLWDEMGTKYQEGVDQVREMRTLWKSLEGKIDEQRFRQVEMLLEIQEDEAIWWKNACLTYFQKFSKMDYPDSIEAPEHDLEYYQSREYPYAPGIRPRW